MKRLFDTKEEIANRENVYYWMNKYISLLEKYNELLLQQSFKEPEEDEGKEHNRPPSSGSFSNENPLKRK